MAIAIVGHTLDLSAIVRMRSFRSILSFPSSSSLPTRVWPFVVLGLTQRRDPADDTTPHPHQACQRWPPGPITRRSRPTRAIYLDIGGILSAIQGPPTIQLINVLTYNLGFDFSRSENRRTHLKATC